MFGWYKNRRRPRKPRAIQNFIETDAGEQRFAAPRETVFFILIHCRTSTPSALNDRLSRMLDTLYHEGADLSALLPPFLSMYFEDMYEQSRTAELNRLRQIADRLVGQYGPEIAIMIGTKTGAYGVIDGPDKRAGDFSGALIPNFSVNLETIIGAKGGTVIEFSAE